MHKRGAVRQNHSGDRLTQEQRICRGKESFCQICFHSIQYAHSGNPLIVWDNVRQFYGDQLLLNTRLTDHSTGLLLTVMYHVDTFMMSFLTQGLGC